MFAVAVGPETLVARQADRWRQAQPGNPAVIIERHGSIALAHTARHAVHWSADTNRLLIGDLFSAEGLSLAPPDRLPASLGALGNFISEAWGSYLLFARTRSENHFAFRDPSGALPLYRLDTPGIAGFISDADAARWFDKDRLDPDPEFLRQWLAFPFLRSSRSGDRAISEILPGEAISVGTGSAVTRSLWTPASVIGQSPPLDDVGEASRLLRQALLTAVPALAGRHRAPLLQLSGGLDSSIICAVLGQSHVRFESVNYRSGHPDSDERPFARAAAQGAGVHLTELTGSIAALGASNLPKALRPLPNLALLPLHAALDGLARLRGSDALLDGGGGDNIFCYLTTAAPVLDAWRMTGWTGARVALDDIARLTESTQWEVLTATFRKRWRRRRRIWRSDHRFLQPDARPAGPDRHPWLSFDPATLPGAREHVEALVGIQHFLDRGQPLLGVPVVHPLLAQPLLDLCLRIPSFLWLRGGHNRAVARHAVQDLLPPAVAARRTKGGLASLFLMTFMSNRLALRERLMEGQLASNGLLDRSALDACLSCPEEPDDDIYVRVLEIAALEEWLQSWDR